MKLVIVHSLDHAKDALAVAAELKLAVTLQSAPDAIFYAGALYLKALFEQAQSAFPQVDATYILDCADAGSDAIAAMQAGHRHVRSHAPAPLKQKLADIARQYDVRLWDAPYEALDLHGLRDTKATITQFLKGAP